MQPDRFPFQKRTLEEASVQEIQLELLRRTQHNALEGPRLVASLLAHKNLWEAVMVDRFCISRPGKLPAIGLVKLRDLPENDWNVDTLYVLCPNAKSAKALAGIAEAEDWGGMVLIHDHEDVDNALGGSNPGQAMISVWWD